MGENYMGKNCMGEKKVVLSEIAIEYLRNKIISGKVKDKEKLIAKEIAEELGMSRGPVREAMLQLQFEGLVSYESNRGCTVSMLSPKEGFEILYLRGNLEILALKCCGGHLMHDTLLMMEEVLEDMKHFSEESLNRTIIECDEIFHRQIILNGQMDRLTSLWESMSPLNASLFLLVQNMKAEEKQMNRMLGKALREEGNVYEIHKKLYDILKKENMEESIEALSNHYRGTGERILKVAMRKEQMNI